MIFKGYRRSDGKAGVRNHILILPTCGCSSEACRMVTNKVKGTVYIPNQNGCGQVKGDMELTIRVAWQQLVVRLLSLRPVWERPWEMPLYL